MSRKVEGYVTASENLVCHGRGNLAEGCYRI